MTMRRARRRSKADITANLTSLIDVTFLLIIFFVLVTRISEDEIVQLDLPRPHSPATMLPGPEQLIVVNVVPDPAKGGGAHAYRVGNKSYAPDGEGLNALTQHVASLYRAHPDLRVSMRADRNTRYEAVEPALDAIGKAARQAGQTPRVNLVVLREG